MSYSRTDEAVMRRIVDFLRSRGINVWVDNEKLVPGTPIWEAEIEKAIFGASATVVILSPDSKASEWVRREISYTERYQKRIFPVLARGDENSSISLRLTNHQYVDIRKEENAGFENLGAALQVYLKSLDSQKPSKLEDDENKESRQKEEKNKNRTPQTPGIQGKIANQRKTKRLPSDEQKTVPGWLSVLWFTLAWAIVVSSLFGMFQMLDVHLFGAIIGTVGGLAVGILLLIEHLLSSWRSVLGIALCWAGGWLIGWSLIGIPIGGVIGGAVGGAIGGFGTAFILRLEKMLQGWKNVLIVTLGWSIGWSMGELLLRTLQVPGLNPAIIVGTMLGLVGGFVTVWRIRSERS